MEKWLEYKMSPDTTQQLLDTAIYDMVKQSKHNRGLTLTHVMPYTVFGTAVCRKAFLALVGIHEKSCATFVRAWIEI